MPFVSREDVDFFQTLEQHLRGEEAPLAGRDHLIYRSYYVPVKGMIDGDCKWFALLLAFSFRTRLWCANSGVVCERYSLLSNEKKQMIAGELDRSVREIERKISVSFPSWLLEGSQANHLSCRTCGHGLHINSYTCDGFTQWWTCRILDHLFAPSNHSYHPFVHMRQ